MINLALASMHPLESSSHLSTLPETDIIALLHSIATKQAAIAEGRPVAMPCHTASITPSVSTIREASSSREG